MGELPKLAEPERKYEPTVRTAVERLEKLADESDDLLLQLRSTFNFVIRPGGSYCAVFGEDSENTSSELGTVLRGFADKLDGNFRAIRDVIDKADI